MSEKMMAKNQMNYEEFKEELVKNLKERLAPGTETQIQTVTRNNQAAAEAMFVWEPGDNATPVIYLKEQYERLLSGVPFSEMVEQILNICSQQYLKKKIDPSLFQDFQKMKSNIVYRLVHYERNKEFLEEVPHVRFLDMAVIFSGLFQSGSFEMTEVVIKNSHMEYWGIHLEELRQSARENTPALLRYQCENLYQLLKKTWQEELGQEEGIYELVEDVPVYMYMLTNMSRFQGAACILYDGLLKRLAGQMGADLYIIPSSIHEVLLVPARNGIEKEDIDQMIQEVNNTVLEPEEFLSDHAYYFSREQNKILW